MLNEVFNGAASGIVLPVSLEQCGTEHDGQIMVVHLVVIRKVLHAETQAVKKTTQVCAQIHTQGEVIRWYQSLCISSHQ